MTIMGKRGVVGWEDGCRWREVCMSLTFHNLVILKEYIIKKDDHCPAPVFCPTTRLWTRHAEKIFLIFLIKVNEETEKGSDSKTERETE